MNRLHKQTRFFSKKHFSICGSFFTVKLWGSVLALPMFRTGRTKMWQMSVFPRETNFLPHRPVAAIPFIKVPVNFFSCKNIQESQMFRLIPHNENLKGGKCQKLHLRMICLENQFRFSSKRLTGFLRFLQPVDFRLYNLSSIISIFRNEKS